MNKDTFDKLDIEVPFIIGEITNYKFVRMQHFGDYMYSIDPDASKIVGNEGAKLSSMDTHLHYCANWQRVLKHSSEFRQNPSHQGLKRDNLANRSQHEHIVVTHPYEVVNERPIDETFGKYSTVWVKPLLVPPGPTSYFLYYRFDDKQDEKSNLIATVQTHIPMRGFATHFYTLPKPRTMPEHLLPIGKKES